MKQTSVLLVLLMVVLVACNISHTPVKFKDIYEQPIKDSQILSTGFSVRMNFSVDMSEVKLYPETWKAVLRALKTWQSYLPVSIVINMQQTRNVILPFDVIKIHLLDDIFDEKDHLIGLWQSYTLTILLDGASLEDKPKQAYSVALHEFGHMFGIPHVINWNENGITGYIVLPKNINAKDYVMYPRQILGKPQDILSDVEIEIAYNNLLYHWTRTDKMTSDCNFLLDTGH